MIVIGAKGLIGNVSTPISMPMRLFSQCLIASRSLQGMSARAVTFVENGRVQFSAEAIASPKTNNIMGSFTAPIVYAFRRNPKGESEYYASEGNQKSVYERVNLCLAKANELYGDRFEKSNGFEANGELSKTIDVLMETVPRVGRDNILMYMDRHDLVIELDLQMKARLDDMFQDFITNELTGIKSIPVPKMIGYGLIRDKWKKMRRPNTYMRIAPRTVLKASRISNEFTKSEWQVQTFYAHLLAEALKRWLGQYFPALDQIEDWLAISNVLIGAFAGYGNTEREQKWQATDIEVSINMMPGMGWTQANRFLWGNVNTYADFKAYFLVMNILGLVVQRVKAPMMDFNIKTILSSNDWQIPSRFKRAMQPNIEGWGSTDTFFFLMPRNNFSYGEAADIPFPCVVDDKVYEKTEDIIAKANNYEDLLPFKDAVFKDTLIDRGEAPPGAIDMKSYNTSFLRLHATNDARIVEYQDDNSQFVRRLIQYRFPMDHIVQNGINTESRFRLWLWGLFANGEKGMKDAFIMDSSLDVFDVRMVNYRRGPLESQIIDKEGTNTVGEQILKPGSLPTPVSLATTSEGVTNVAPPAPEPKPAFTSKVYEDSKGNEIREVSSKEEKANEAADETNNQPEST